MRPYLPFALLAIALLFVTGEADARLSQIGTPAVAFLAKGPLGLEINGKTNELTVTEADDGATTVTVPLAKLDTGIGLRNEHMREKYLEVDKFPNAVLVVPRSALKVPAAGATTATVPAKMTLHGQTHPVNVRYTATRTDAGLDVSGAVHINMTDYGISVPTHLGITVEPGVDITVKFGAVDS